MRDDEHVRQRAMERAVRLAVRGRGRVEPNPMVGCVVLDANGAEAGWGWHRRIGGDHAEVEALRRAGARAKGGTAVVTLEPCAHHGRTPPCTTALIAAGVARVVYASADPNPLAAGGAELLRRHGIETLHRPCRAADELNAPFLLHASSHRPWVSVKWAQSIDGAIACRNGASRWISSERMRRAVHRERGRVDAILSGIGTVLSDDPRLTARHGTIRRPALRVVVDPSLSMPLESNLVRSAAQGPAVLVAASRAAASAAPDTVERLRSRGVRVLTLGEGDDALDGLLRTLAADHAVSRVLVESGGGLVGSLLRRGLVDECWVVVAPRLCGDASAIRPVRGLEPESVDAMASRRLVGSWRRGDEMLLCYR